MKRLTFVPLMLVVILGLGACRKPIVQPAFQTVDRLAIVSLYTNHDIYNVKEADSNVTLATALHAAMNPNQGLADEHVQLATASLISYSEEMERLAQWKVVPTPDVLDHPAYADFLGETTVGGPLYGMATANQVTPPGMALVPFDSVVGQKGRKVLVNGEDPTEAVRRRLADLALDLDVDAVAVVDVDVAYKTGPMVISGTGLFAGIRAKARPSISSAAVIVTRDGEVALQTPHIQRGKGDRYETSGTPMLRQGRVDLTGDKGAESIVAISEAVQFAAGGLVEQIENELTEG